MACVCVCVREKEGGRERERSQIGDHPQHVGTSVNKHSKLLWSFYLTPYWEFYAFIAVV